MAKKNENQPFEEAATETVQSVAEKQDALTDSVTQGDSFAEAHENIDGANEQEGMEKIAVSARHKTAFPVYRRAGLLLKQTPQDFKVTSTQLAALEKDKWVEVKKK